MLDALLVEIGKRLDQTIMQVAIELAQSRISFDLVAENIFEVCHLKRGAGALRLLRLQRPGRAPMAAEDLLRGYALPPGTVLG